MSKRTLTQAWTDFYAKCKPIRLPLPKQKETVFKDKKKYNRKKKHKNTI